jgi:hypothetical protein
MTSQNKESLWKKSVYEIGPPSWIKKEIKTNSLKKELVSTTVFLLNELKSYFRVKLLGSGI